MMLLLVAACAAEPETIEVTRIVEVEVTPEGGMMIEEANRLQTIKDRGTVICASRNDVPWLRLPGFQPATTWGFDIDLCRAIATAAAG